MNKPPVENHNKKGKTRGQQDKTRSSKPVEQKQKRKHSKKRGNQKPRKASNQRTKSPTSSKTDKKHEHTPSIQKKS